MLIKNIIICFGFFLAIDGVLANMSLATNAVIKNEGAYQVVEGRVSDIKTRILTVDGRQYPISVFVRVFDGSTLALREMRLHELVAIGRVDKAKLYLLRDKVEKIVVLKNI